MNWSKKKKKMAHQFYCHRAGVLLKLINQSYNETIYSLLLFTTCCGIHYESITHLSQK